MDVSSEVTALAGLVANIVSTRQANGDDIYLVDVNSGYYVDESNLATCSSAEGNPNNMSATNCKQAPDGSGLVPDGVHPNLLGEAFIGRQFADVLVNQVDLCTVFSGSASSAPESTGILPNGEIVVEGAQHSSEGITSTDAANTDSTVSKYRSRSGYIRW